MDISKIGANGNILYLLFSHWGKRKSLTDFFFLIQFLRCLEVHILKVVP